jgi:hypothetical protein
LFPTLPEHVQLVYCQQVGPGRGLKNLYRFESTVDRNTSRPVSVATYKTLTHAIAWNCSLGAALSAGIPASSHETVCEELFKVWIERLIRLVPRPRTFVKIPEIDYSKSNDYGSYLNEVT